MALESEGFDADPLTRCLLNRLTARRSDVLPELPDSKVLALLSSHHRRGIWVGFPEPAADPT